MKVRAEAIPLDGPLPGGVEGASVIIEPMEAGRAHLPPAAVERERGPLARFRALGWRVPRTSWLDTPITAFLVRHPGIGPVLIDTGLHPSVSSDPRDNLGRIGARIYELAEGDDVPAQLRSKGVRTGEVGLVILTHLHMDHASAISEFPEAVFVVSEEEWQTATTIGRPAFHHYRRAHFDFGFEFVSVDFDSDQVDSYGPFGRTFDLLGDGSIRLVYTPGESAGHMSVILRLPRRDFVVVGDAAYTWHQFESEHPPFMLADEHNWRRSLHELQQYRRAYPYALLVPGHDPEFFPKLDPRYEE